MPSLDAFQSYSRAAAPTLACLATANLLHDAEPPTPAPSAIEALGLHLEASLVAFDGRARLVQAAARGDADGVKAELDSPKLDGPKLDGPKLDGPHAAHAPRHVTIDSQLPEWPPDGFTALHAAAQAGHISCVELLVARGASLDLACCDGRRPLHLAAECRSEGLSGEIVSFLLNHGASLGATSLTGETPLHSAAVAGRLSAAKALLVRGADTAVRNRNGYTPADAATTASQDVCCRAPGADWGAVLALLGKLEILDASAAAPFARHTWHLHVCAALQDAAEGGDVETLRWLLQCYTGEDVDARDHDGTTALSAAALAGQTAACALLIEKRARVDTLSNLHEQPLHFAAREGHLACVMLLVKHGADVTARTKGGSTPADFARRQMTKPTWLAVVEFLEGRRQQVDLQPCLQQATARASSAGGDGREMQVDADGPKVVGDELMSLTTSLTIE